MDMIMKFLEFTFSDFWHFMGVLILWSIMWAGIGSIGGKDECKSN